MYEVLPSSQDEARRLAASGAPAGTLVWAARQTAGRGRADRRWTSPAGGLWFSVVLRPRLDPPRAAFITVLAGVAMADALRRRTGADVRLKWPNDLRVRGRKVGGILAEAALGGAVVDWVVLGVGVNLSTPPGGFDADLRDLAIALDGVGNVPEPAVLLASCLGALERRYEELVSAGPEPARRRWLRLSETIGKNVRAELDGRTVAGRAVDLDPTGALVLRTDRGIERVSAGEVVHLR